MVRLIIQTFKVHDRRKKEKKRNEKQENEYANESS